MTDKARELLERVLTGIDRYGDIYPETLEEIRDFLSTPESTQDEEPVAWMHPYGGILKSPTTVLERETYNIPLFLHPAPRKPFVWLSEEEIMAIVRSDPEFDEMMWDKTAVRFARAIEDALEEKNG